MILSVFLIVGKYVWTVDVLADNFERWMILSQTMYVSQDNGGWHYATPHSWERNEKGWEVGVCQTGSCTDSIQCSQSGGTASGQCYLPYMRGPGVCCQNNPKKNMCGMVTNENTGAFKSPNFPAGNKRPLNCVFTMNTKSGTCGIRVDFVKVNLAPSRGEACYHDLILILAMNQQQEGNAPFCGILDGYSTVVPVKGGDSVQVVVTTQTEGALWNIQVSQISCYAVKPPVEESCGIPNADYNFLIPNIPSLRFRNTQPMFRPKQKDEGRILGGTRTPHLFPWAVALFFDKRFSCGGSLITHEWVLTASHCVNRDSSGGVPDITRYVAVLGADEIYNANEKRLRVQLNISNIVRYPQYYAQRFHDIALLRLAEPVSFTAAVRPVCLPHNQADTYEGRRALITGWGKTLNNTVPDFILSAWVTILSNANCSAAWRSRDVVIRDYMLCAGIGMFATCEGDSGGPLMVQDKDTGLLTIVGIDSFGTGDGPLPCGSYFYPDVWMRVTYFLGWISLVLAKV